MTHEAEAALKITYLLEEIPNSIAIGNPEVTFRLTGLLALQPRHAVAFGRRLQGQWEKYDNLRNGVINVHSQQEVKPMMLFYTEA